MRAVKSNWLAFAIMAALAGGCGDSTASNDGEGTGSTGGGDAGKGNGADGGRDAGKGNGGDGSSQQCGAQEDGTIVDTSKTGGCYYFYCNETKESILAQSTKGGQCANATDVAIQCEGQSVRTVAGCARMSAGQLVSGTKAFAAAVTKCARADTKLSKDLSDGCLDCNVQSSVCAAENCLAECVQGDSVACDTCRETKKCTSDFYVCGGLPDPNKP